MSSTTSLPTSTNLTPQKSDSAYHADLDTWDFATAKRDSANHEDLDINSVPAKSTFVTDANAPPTPVSPASSTFDPEPTPRPQSRSQSHVNQLSAEGHRSPGFSWGASSTIRKLNSDHSHSPALSARLGSIADSKPASLQSSNGTQTPASGSGEDVSRKDTGRSSASSFARGFRRVMPDLRLFHDTQKSPEESSIPPDSERFDGYTHPPTKIAYVPTPPPIPPPTLVPSPALKKAEDKPPKHVHLADETTQKSTSVPPKPTKGGLKDRRNLDQTESLRLTLPMELPILPGPQRMPVSDFVNIRDLPPPRPRSPRTPWIHSPSSSLTPPITGSQIPSASRTAMPASADGLKEKMRPTPLHNEDSVTYPHSPQSPHSPYPQKRRLKDRRYISRPLFGRSRSGASDHAPVRTPEGVLPSPSSLVARPMEEGQHSDKQSRRRWGGPWSSNTEPPTPESPPHDLPSRRFSLTRFFNPRKHKRSSSATSPAQAPSGEEQKNQEPLTLQEGGKDTITSMPMTYNFVPPGLQRVPTPPVFDSNGKIQGRLADFFFDHSGDSHDTKRSPNAPLSEWDSDALLMSQNSTIISAPGSSSESPLQSSCLPTPNEPARLSKMGHITGLSTTPSLPIGHPNWFRVQYGSEGSHGSDSLPAEERAKIEWLIPEHLPGSPLCPLHAKYKGPSKGLCVFHGRQKKLSGVERRRTGSDETPASEKPDSFSGAKKRRLASLSGP